jgi:hypothetical protein
LRIVLDWDNSHCIIRVAVTSSTLDRRWAEGCDNARAKKAAKISGTLKNKLCYYAARSALKLSFNNCNGARHKGRIPQYTKSSISE